MNSNYINAVMVVLLGIVRGSKEKVHVDYRDAEFFLLRN
jgi:hypothetical protein